MANSPHASILYDEDSVRNLLAHLGEDPQRQGLVETPARVLKAYSEMFSGYQHESPASILKAFTDGAERAVQDHGMVVQTNIPVWSMCEHHMLPFFGVAHIGYIPNDRIVGLSKMSRLVNVFARRLQVQERLGQQIADMLVEALSPIGVGVVLECRHTCMEARGVCVAGTVTTTSVLRGVLMTVSAARAEFMALAKRDRPL